MERITWKAEWRIVKFVDPQGEIARRLKEGAPLEEVIASYGGCKEDLRFEGNVALNEGLQAIIDMICNLSPVTPWDSAHARVGVGDGSASPDASQTGLLGENQAYAPMDAGYPVRTNQTAEWRGTFGGDEANFHWYEFTVDNGPDAQINLNRTVADKGVKSAGETWVLDLKITFS